MSTKLQAIVKENNKIEIIPKNRVALSGKEILDSLVQIAYEMETSFQEKQLSEWWHPFTGDLSQYLLSILKKHNLNDEDNSPYPFWAYAKHHFIKKKDLFPQPPQLRVINNQYSSIPEKEELLNVSFHICYCLHYSQKYFIQDSLNEWFQEIGIPKIMIPHLSNLYSRYQRFKGKRDEGEVENEIKRLLNRSRINPAETTLSVLFEDEDGFNYKKRNIFLRRKRGKQGILDTNDASLISLLWGQGIYARDSQDTPLAYTIFKSQEKKIPIQNPKALV